MRTHRNTHTHMRQCEKAQGSTGSGHSPRPQEPPPSAWGPPAWAVAYLACLQPHGARGPGFRPRQAVGNSGCQRESGAGQGPGLPAAQRGAHHVWVGLVGQPQRPQVELLFELGLLGVEECKLLPDLPAMRPQTLILGVLEAGHVRSAQERITSAVDFVASSSGSTS